MIARHSLEQSGDGEGVEVVENKECEDPVHGKGQFTEKHIHLSRFVSFFNLDLGRYLHQLIVSHLSISAVCPIGCRQSVHGCSTLLKSRGTIIRTR